MEGDLVGLPPASRCPLYRRCFPAATFSLAARRNSRSPRGRARPGAVIIPDRTVGVEPRREQSPGAWALASSSRSGRPPARARARSGDGRPGARAIPAPRVRPRHTAVKARGERARGETCAVGRSVRRPAGPAGDPPGALGTGRPTRGRVDGGGRTARRSRSQPPVRRTLEQPRPPSEDWGVVPLQGAQGLAARAQVVELLGGPERPAWRTSTSGGARSSRRAPAAGLLRRAARRGGAQPGVRDRAGPQDVLRGVKAGGIVGRRNVSRRLDAVELRGECGSPGSQGAIDLHARSRHNSAYSGPVASSAQANVPSGRARRPARNRARRAHCSKLGVRPSAASRKARRPGPDRKAPFGGRAGARPSEALEKPAVQRIADRAFRRGAQHLRGLLAVGRGSAREGCVSSGFRRLGGFAEAAVRQVKLSRQASAPAASREVEQSVVHGCRGLGRQRLAGRSPRIALRQPARSPTHASIACLT